MDVSATEHGRIGDSRHGRIGDSRRELDALVAEAGQKLRAAADNPLIVIEQLRGKALRLPVRGVKKRLAAIQVWCDKLHGHFTSQPGAGRWRTELVAYERAQYQARKAQDADGVVCCPHCLKVLHTRWKGGLTAAERAKRLRERQLRHFAETQRRG